VNNIIIRHITLIILVLISDIVFSVEIPRLRWVSVNIYTGNIDLKWEASATPGIEKYSIHRGVITTLNGQPDKTMELLSGAETFNLSFSFTPAAYGIDVFSNIETFGVKAHIGSEDSQVDDISPSWDSTMLLQADFDECLAKIDFSWNKYDFNMWPSGTMEYRIYVSENGGEYQFFDKVPSNKHNYSTTNIEAYNDYRFFVAALSVDNPGDSATSNYVDINTTMEKLPDYLNMDYATYNNNNAEINILVDPESELTTYHLYRSASEQGVFDSITQIVTSDKTINYIDEVDYNNGPYYYKVYAVNRCGNKISESENIASTLILSRSGSSLQPVLSWNKYINWINGVAGYNVYRKIGERDFGQIYSGSELLITDNELGTLAGTNQSADVCYKVTAYKVSDAYSSNSESHSNEICYTLPVNIRFEFDAFIPGDSQNGSFGPAIDFLPDDFKMEIINRSGMVVFSTTNPETPRWDGRIKGRFAPSGAYMCVVQYRTGSGKRKVIRTGVVVAYP